MMKQIDLYTFVYNDEDILPFFLDYYSFVDRMTFIDSGSIDKTLSILHKFATIKHPEIRITQTGQTYWNQEPLHEIRNNIWRDSKYDLILFPDCDEIFYTESGIQDYLNSTNYDIYEMEGFEMISDKFPKTGTKLTDIRTGFRFHPFNKSTIFKPQIELHFLNAHLRYSPTQNVDMTGNIKLLHYRSLGLEMMRKRNKRMIDRLPEGYNGHHAETEIKLLSRYNDWMGKAIQVI
jgi:hypothetical protein